MRVVKVYVGGKWVEPEAYEIESCPYTGKDVLIRYRINDEDCSARDLELPAHIEPTEHFCCWRWFNKE